MCRSDFVQISISCPIKTCPIICEDSGITLSKVPRRRFEIIVFYHPLADGVKTPQGYGSPDNSINEIQKTYFNFALKSFDNAVFESKMTAVKSITALVNPYTLIY